MCLWRRFVREKRFRWYGKQFLRERFSRGWGGCIKTSLCPLMRPAGGVGPLEVRFAHPVRLAPATHSQGHGRPCLQRLHPPPPGFSEDLIFVVSLYIFAVLNNNTGKYVKKCNKACVSCIFVGMDEGASVDWL